MQIDQWNFPNDLYYHEKHAWAKVEGDIVTTGVTDFIQFLAGEISYIDLPKEGDEFEQGSRIGTFGSEMGCCGGGGGWIGNYVAPVKGEIIEVNKELEKSPALINSSPYGDGWIVKMKMSNPSDLEKLMKDPEKVRAFVFSEVNKITNK